MTPRDTELLPYLNKSESVFSELSYLANLVIIELGKSVSYASNLPTFHAHIAIVIADRTQEKVVRIDAKASIATMTNTLPSGD
jgi:hypothetical protein